MTSPKGDHTPVAVGGVDQEKPKPLFEYWLILRRRWYFPIAFALLAAGAVYWHSAGIVPVYKATSELLIDSVTPNVVNGVEQVYDFRETWNAERYYNTQYELLRSRNVQASVAKQVGWIGQDASPEDEAIGAAAVDAHVVIHPLPANNIVKIHARHADPEIAQQIANAVVESYLSESRRHKQRHTNKAVNYLEDFAAQVQTRLRLAEQRLEEYFTENNLPGINFNESHAALSSPLVRLRTERMTFFTEQLRLESLKKELNSLKKEGLTMMDSDTGSFQVPIMSAMKQKRALLATELAGLSERYGPKHPKVLQLKATIRDLDSGINTEAADFGGQIQVRLAALRSTIAMVDIQIESETKNAIELRKTEDDYSALKSDVEEERSLLANVRIRLRETSMLDEMATSNASVVSEAVLPFSPILPNTALHLSFGLLVGLLMGFGLAYAIEAVDDHVRSADEVEKIIGQPLIGVISRVTKRAPGIDLSGGDIQKSIDEYVAGNSRSIVAEDFHSAATSLLSLYIKAPPRTIAITSPNQADGKSLFSIGLASVFAARGRKVLLIDADMRKGRLHKAFGVPHTEGFYDCLSGETPFHEATRRTEVDGLDIMTRGKVPAKVSPVRVLELDDLPKLIEEARKHYDMILFDTPPATVVSDAQVLSKCVDGVIALARHNKTSRRSLMALQRLIQLSRIPVVGCVLTDVEQRSYSYYRAYGYSHSGYADKEFADA